MSATLNIKLIIPYFGKVGLVIIGRFEKLARKPTFPRKQKVIKVSCEGV